MKKILFIGTFGILLFFSASAEFGAWRKSGVKCGQGQNALGCIISSLKDNTLGQKLNCSETYFLEQVAEAYNRQAGTSFTAGDARNAFLDGQMFIVDWPASDLMNSGLKAGTAHYFPMTGSGNVKVIASKDLSGRTIPLVKDEGTGGQACFNVCYSKSMIPYKDPEPKKDAEKKDPPPATVIQLPAPTPTQMPLPLPTPTPTQQVVLDWPSQPVLMNNQQLLQINPVIPVQPVFTVLPQKQCCNTWSRPAPAPNPTGNGFPSEGNPGWGELPVSGDPGWGGHGVSYNNDPIAGDPGWNGNQPTYWSNGNTGNNGGNTNNGNGPVE